MFPPEAFENTLLKAAGILESLSIRFHLTGGITSVVYGEPRLTQDLDLVIDNAAVAAQLGPFLAALSQSDFLFDEGAIRYAIESERMFQLLDGVEALKLDIYPRELVPGELSRSVLVELFEGVSFPISSRIDATVSKLVWISRGSHKSRRDVRQLVRTSSETEKESVHEMCDQLGLLSLLAEVLNERDEPIE